MYNADLYYFKLMKGDTVDGPWPVAPETYAELKTRWSALHEDLLAWARESLSTQKDIVLKGWGVWPCWIALMQMVSHGTHHLGQVVTLVRQAGYTPAPDEFTDLIFYYIQRFPQENQLDWRSVFGMTPQS